MRRRPGVEKSSRLASGLTVSRFVRALVLAAMTVFLAAAVTDRPLYLDPGQPIEKRVEDLLGRMTLKEKVGQMNMPCVYLNQLGQNPAKSGKRAGSSPWARW